MNSRLGLFRRGVFVAKLLFDASMLRPWRLIVSNRGAIEANPDYSRCEQGHGDA
jgi:hypothetical protein